jgi:hypothetical protein
MSGRFPAESAISSDVLLSDFLPPDANPGDENGKTCDRTPHWDQIPWSSVWGGRSWPAAAMTPP